MDYSVITTDRQFVWSYSRLKAFERCKYGWLLSYIYNSDKDEAFFAQYGSFMHHIIQQYLSGELSNKELTSYYLINFKKQITAKAPNGKIFNTYFKDGLRYCKSPTINPTGVDMIESELRFTVNNNDFVGYVDLVLNGDKLVICDHKSRALKPRSHNIIPTKTDKELDQYFKQLYLYSIAINEKYGRYPDELWINCFRTGSIIKEKFNELDLEKATMWADKLIQTITHNQTWEPNIDWFQCQYLCNHHTNCEYFQNYER